LRNGFADSDRHANTGADQYCLLILRVASALAFLYHGSAILFGAFEGPGWDATTTLQRSDFGLTWNQTIEGTRIVGDEVQIEVRIEADKQ
jgi:hypothetical protein